MGRSGTMLTLACMMVAPSTQYVSAPLRRAGAIGFTHVPLRSLFSGGTEPPRRRGAVKKAPPKMRPATRMPMMPSESVVKSYDPFEWRPKPSAVPGGIRKPSPERILLKPLKGSAFDLGEESEEELPFYRAPLLLDGLDAADCTQVAENLHEDAIALMLEALKPEEEDGWENGVELSLVLCGDEEMTKLNKKWMGKEYPTDVLSFPMDGDEGLLGDIVICLGTAKRQAEEEGLELRDEMRILLLHGFLHLLGYDHETGAEDMAEMSDAEISMMKRMGWKGQGLIGLSMTEEKDEKDH